MAYAEIGKTGAFQIIGLELICIIRVVSFIFKFHHSCKEKSKSLIKYVTVTGAFKLVRR